MLRTHLPVLPLVAAFVATAFAQEPPKPAADAPAVPPVAPLTNPRAQRAPGATLPVEKIDTWRDGRTVPVTTSGTLFDLDLSTVDFASDPLLVIDDRPILKSDVDRAICLLLASNEMEQFITAVLLRRLKAEMQAKGEVIPAVAVTDEEIQKKFDTDKQMTAQMQGMTPEEYERQIRELFGWERYVEFQRLQLEFERILLPDPPPEFVELQAAKWKPLEVEWKKQVEEAKKKAAQDPPAGTEGEKPQPPGTPPRLPVVPPPAPVPDADLSWISPRTWELMDPRFVQTIKDNYARGMPLHPLIRQAVAAAMRANLLKSVEVKAAPADDPEALLHVGGEAVKTRDLLTLVGGRVDATVRRMALRELIQFRVADRRLQEDGALISQEEADAALKAFEKQNETSILPVAQIIRLYGFNSLWHYRPYYLRKESYKRLVERTVPEEKLRDHYEKSARIFFESGTVLSQVLFIPGADRAQARQEMDAALAEVHGGKPFAAVARETGKFPDGGEVRQGNIAPVVRTKLRQALGENEYIAFLTGYSLADEAFYVAKEGSIVGPVWRDYSPKLTGWLALRVDRYFTTGQKKSFDEQKDRVQDDYADLTFPRYVNEALANSRIVMPKRP